MAYERVQSTELAHSGPRAAPHDCCFLNLFLFIIQGHHWEYYGWRDAPVEADKVRENIRETERAVLLGLCVCDFHPFLPFTLRLFMVISWSSSLHYFAQLGAFPEQQTCS